MEHPVLKESYPGLKGQLPDQGNPRLDLSVVIPITERYDDLRLLYQSYASELKRLERSFEFIFVIDGQFPGVLETLQQLKSENPSIRIIKFERSFGEAAALLAGFNFTSGKRILTLSSYFQVEPSEIGKVIEAMDGTDLVITRRYPRTDSLINRFQSRVFHWLVSRFTGAAYHDITCGLRGMSRAVAQELDLYGDLHRFIPLMAYKHGFKVAEVPVRQHPMDRAIRIFQPGIYLRRFLDILTVFFLTKFTRKPLRFFGLIGSTLFFTGSLVTLYLGLYRIFGFGGIAERPLLLLGVLLMVLGVQLFSIGLIGEIVIFTHARQMKDYRVEEILD